ncbi:cupin domain-containing protein [Allochromatium palmeri]|uniref:Cupin domain-containing protein n=1 Tax=Allochromatium palmeri TaxID=231048 RepID=A0A6N8EHG9_9GAMM|nr:cupin domain-containing protein [Allochromatium palmeri]MTW23061.1 cupin domain-containing protein [Allochromatium palmeri]
MATPSDPHDPVLTVRNLFADLPTLTSGECFEELAVCRGVRIERILSSDQPESVLYDQAQDEWVCLLQGEARLWIAGDDVELRAGDHVLIPAHTPHRVLNTSREPPCLWLAVHIHPHEQ